MSRYYWLKLKRDFFKRHDIQIIEAMPNGKDYILFYLKLLCESVDHDGNLRFNEEIPYNEEMLATITRTNVDVVRSAIKIFTQLQMMEMMDDGTFYMSEVEKMLGSETQWAEKKRAYRERQKLLASGQCPPEEDNVLAVSDKSKSKSKSKSKDIYSGVPEELKEAFMEWAEMRKAIKKPITTKTTVTRALNKLNSLAKTTEEKIALIELATDRCWQGFYLPREEEKKPVEPKKYKEFEKEPWQKDDFEATQMPEELRERLGGMFNAD